MGIFKKLFRRKSKAKDISSSSPPNLRSTKSAIYPSSSHKHHASSTNLQAYASLDDDSLLEPPRPAFLPERPKSAPGSKRNSLSLGRNSLSLNPLFSASRSSLVAVLNKGHRRRDSAVSFYDPTLPTPINRLSKELLTRVFEFVCPHATDSSYEPCELTTTENGCMLCDMRDLSHLSLVSPLFRLASLPLQYTHLRIDSVHYCSLEDVLDTRRRRGSVFQKKEDAPSQIPETRLKLLYRTLQEKEELAHFVRSVKVPYMIREACKADLARLVSLTPKLKYADLPEGVGSADKSCSALLGVLWARCPDLRSFNWSTGGEDAFLSTISQRPWPKLERISITALKIEDSDLLRFLDTLLYLTDLTLTNLPWLTESLFTSPIFPSNLRKLSLSRLPTEISTLTLLPVLPTLTHLTLDHTTHPDSLPLILSTATSLTYLSITYALPRPSSSPPQPLSSRSLRSLHYLITSPRTHSYYLTLASSLTKRQFPMLYEVYVREDGFWKNLPKRGGIRGLCVNEKGGGHQLEWGRYVVGAKKDGGDEVRREWTKSLFGEPKGEAEVPVPWLWEADGGLGGVKVRGGEMGGEKRRSRGDLWR